MLLIVDDDPAFLEKAVGVLNSGRGIFLAGDAEQAKLLMSLMGAEFSLMLIDLELPGQDGFSFIRELHCQFPNLLLIAITGVYDAYALETARMMGAVAALSKPITNEWDATIARARSRAIPTTLS